MTQVSVVAKVTVQPGKRDELVKAFTDFLPTVEAEAGTLEYALHLDASDAEVAWVTELYDDNDALTAHSTSPAFAEFGKVLGGLLAGRPELHILTPSVRKGG